ncbi:hypothetical protein JZ751_015319 [Albula glossodonta]|uniref:Hsp70-interacting protein N-terminal domain-containing protein n=1 Tax=Albula glossodonta TaxID=121402 RepID=A0A8T2NV30_9TELE|nr:hypothetical protein JZ751_015319 [Albula glossodonta]
MDPRKVVELKAFVQLCAENPSVLHLPELGFLRTWLQGGAHVLELLLPLLQLKSPVHHQRARKASWVCLPLWAGLSE